MIVTINIRGGHGIGKTWLIGQMKVLILAHHPRAVVLEHVDTTDKDGVSYEHIEFDTRPVIDELLSHITEDNRHDEN